MHQAITKELTYNATIEAIYWWNRTESYYHRYFSNLENIYSDKPLLAFFTNKIFDVFLKDYSIRRNISSGYQKVDKFIDDLFEFDFVREVQRGNLDVIDSVSKRIKSKGDSTKKNTISLLSKISFLINSKDFALCDTLAKNALWNLYKKDKSIQRKSISSYSGFINQIKVLLSEMEQQELFSDSSLILNQFNGTEAHKYFSKTLLHIR